MARFLKLTNAYGNYAGIPVAINIDQIVSIKPMVDKNYGENVQLAVLTVKGTYYVQETFEKVTGSLPN